VLAKVFLKEAVEGAWKKGLKLVDTDVPTQLTKVLVDLAR